MRPRLFVLTLLAAAAGCGGQHSVGTTYTLGYLATDSCSTHANQKDCVAQTGCAWAAPACPDGVSCPPGICYAPDPCLGISDATQCQADARCAWSDVSKLCPVGATCPNGGFCHPKDPNGGGCACVTPIACPSGAPCPPPECDCNGGGAGGGTCTCACPACAPGQPCPPCSCDCGPGSGGGCVNGGTCACACPACAPNEPCPPCSCDCGSGGAVPAPPPPTGGTTAPDPCMAHTDQASCTADTAAQCQWYATGVPCPDGQTCAGGVCQSPNASGGGTGTGSGGCACACPGCDPATQNCPPCSCDCGGTDPGCVPPPMPAPTPTPCPALGCDPQCPNGVTTDANGCPTCTCA